MKTVFLIITSIILSSVVFAQSGKNMSVHMYGGSSGSITNYTETDLQNLKSKDHVEDLFKNFDDFNFSFNTKGVGLNKFQDLISGSRKSRLYFAIPENEIIKEIPIAQGICDYEIMTLRYDVIRYKRKNIKVSFEISFGADFPEYSLKN
ncbi:MAG: hypothetical protein JEY96_05590 [Bacteroidales bacterium]|nr:hypothetical protein [Bacteroidales bacterium]